MRARSAPVFCLPVWISLALHSIGGTEIIEQGQSITHPNTIISSAGKFELGFFSPEHSSNSNTKNYYLGIWHKVSKQRIVWVANREYPLLSGSFNLTINSKGILVISDGQMFYEVTHFTTSSNETFAMLLDSGNLILQDKISLEILWQSFDYPTDTILPGMNLGYDMVFGNHWSLVSWRSPEDPAPGSFSLEYVRQGNLVVRRDNLVDQRGNLVVRQGSKTYWTGPLAEFESDVFYYILNYELSRYFTCGSLNGSNIMHLVLDVFGQLKVESWSTDDKTWLTLKSSKCSYRRCGNFSICNVISDKACSCLRGFKPFSANNRTKNEISQGCVRKTDLQCNMNSTGGGFLQNDGFYLMKFVEYPSGKSLLKQIISAVACQAACLSNCSCLAYTYDHKLGCLQWYGDLFDLKQLAINSSDGKNFYLKLPNSELMTEDAVSAPPSNDHKNTGNNKTLLWTITVLSISLSLLILWFFVHYVRNKLRRQGEDLLKFDLAMSLKLDDRELTEANTHPAHRKPEVKLPLFSFASVSAATDNFSPTNKLGEGGFGPVYKGLLLKGDEIAVKRLSKRSGQGWEELKNEALLIAKLQHKNLVRLLGCCIEKDEKILIYEYMPNKSLDFFLFDSVKRRMLDWETRVRIIEGIAQGLLYLHQYSRLRIIHRDLKASNILLDNDMNPKISDFGMARIFGGDELQANTNRIVGTYGYMSPEYALEGLFSIKSDVFSFGVLILEIVSGKKNTGFYQSDSLHLLGHAWDLWISKRGLELIDPVIEEVSTHLAMRILNVGLLCVQESANDRPTMSDVVSMLNNESKMLLSPKQPAFLNVRSGVKGKPHLGHSRPETCSANDITVSALDAR